MKNLNQFFGFAFCFLIAILPFTAYSQYSIGLNQELKKIAEKSPSTAWIYFRKEAAIKPEDLFTLHAKAFGLSEADEMRLVSTSENPMTGYTYQKFQQYHNGVKVFSANIRVISENGIAIKATGHVIKNLPLPVSNFKNKDEAVKRALNLMPEKDFVWLDAKRVEKFRTRKKDPSASLEPKAELMYLSVNGDTATSSFSLCWKVEVGMQRSDSKVMMLNAASGELVKMASLNHTCNGTTVATPMNANQTIYTSKQGRCNDQPDYYELWDDCGSRNIDIENDDFGSGTDDPICSSDNIWLTEYGLDGDGVQVLWGMRTTYDWFLNRYGWESYNGGDNGGFTVDCTINFEFGDNPYDNGNNAQYNGFEEDFDFGYGNDGSDPFDSYTALDIVAHEFTHGVNDYTADEDVIFLGEAGALNESFSDIFGEAIEQMTVNLTEDQKWYNGQAKSTGPVRNMKNPHLDQAPDTYLTDQYWSTSEDHGIYYHTNCGVQNHFFYVLCEGESSTNANGDDYTVSGIGLYKAIDIAWNVLRYEYISDADGYLTDRDAWLEAAKDMYGNCSPEEIAVGKAWYAAGVGEFGFDSTVISFNVDATIFDETIQAIGDAYTLGNVEVTSNSPWEVKFLSGIEVTLNPGFYAVSGTNFTAAVDPCSYTLHDDPQRVAYGNEASENASQSLLNEKSTSVFPNPFTQQFNFTYGGNFKTTNPDVKVYDVMGRVIFRLALTPALAKYEITFDAHNWNPGMYLLKIFDDGVLLGTEKLIKE